MNKKQANRDKENIKTEYRGVKMTFFPEKTLTLRKLIHCSKCNEENIISFTIDAKQLKKIFNKKGISRDKEIDKIFEALVSVPPPKSWKEDKEKEVV